MSAISEQPTNKNFLSPLGFKFIIKKTPNVNYFVQTCSLPSITLNRVDVGTPFVKIPFAGDHLDFGELSINFKVDEDLKNYMEIYNWLIGIGFPDNFDQYKAIDYQRKNTTNTGTVDRMTGAGVYSDATLTILSSHRNPIHSITFQDAFPTSLGELEFSATNSDVDYLTCTATFAYRKYAIETL